MAWLSFLVRIYAAAREVKRENDGGEGEGDGEKIALNAFTGFSPPPPSRDIARCGGKGRTHSRPYRVRLSRDFSQPPQMGSLLAGYLLRWTLTGKTKQCIQFSMNLGRVFVFYNPPPPRWNEEPLQSHLKKARKSYPDLKCICVRNNKNFNYQQILPLLFLHVVASFSDF